MVNKITISNTLNNIIFISLILLPIFLITGNFLTDFAVSISALSYLIYSLLNKDFHLFNNKFIKFFFLFNLYIIFNSLISDYPSHSIESSLFYFRYTFFIMAVIHIINSRKKTEKIFFIILFLSFFVVIIDGLYQYFVGINFIGIEKPGNRLNGLFNDEWVIGSYAVRLLPLSLLAVEFLFNNNKYRIYIYIILFILSDLLIFYSGERTAFFLVVIFNLLSFIFIKGYIKLRVLSIIISSLIIIFSLNNNNDLKYRTITQTLEQFGLIKSEKLNIYSPQYEAHYLTAWRMFIDKPIFGHGPNVFRKVCSDSRYKVNELGCSTHPHNFTMQFLSELGIVGFFFYFVFIIWTFRYLFLNFKSLRKYNHNYHERLLLILGCIICTLPFAPSGSIFNNWLPVFSFLYIAFLIQRSNKNPIS